MAKIEKKTVYVQQDAKGLFYDSSDWDGDWLTKNPVFAEQREIPWVETGGYTCRKIEVTTVTFPEHIWDSPKKVLTHPFGYRGGVKVKYHCSCRACGLSTKAYATEEMALLRSSQTKCLCQVQSWRFLD